MLSLPALRAMAHRAQPTFLEKGDFVMARAAEQGPQTTGGSDSATRGRRRLIGSRAYVPCDDSDDGCVCWVSAAGCLTPLHYDLDEGLLAQVPRAELRRLSNTPLPSW